MSLLAALALVGLALTAASLGARQWWVADLATHFRVQLALGLAACAVGLLVLRAPGWAAAAGAGAAFNMVVVLPLFLPASDPTRLDARALTVFLANVHRANPDHAAVVSMIQKEQPAVAVLLEVDQGWLDSLGPLAATYPHRVTVPRDDNFGLAVLSRVPLSNTVTRTLGTQGGPAIITRVMLPDAPVTVVAAHPPPPLGGAASAERNRQFSELATLVRQQSGPVVLCADLNTSPWSPHFVDLVNGTGLVDARRGFGIQATWNAHWPRLTAIPIDHCLVSPEIGVRGFRYGPEDGSDHLPLIVDLALDRP